jgi:hydrogenase maturation protease
MNGSRYRVVGLGNPLLSDDAIGLIVIEKARQALNNLYPDISFIQNTSGGFDLLYDVIGYDGVLFIDSISTRAEETGMIREFSIGEIDQYAQPRLKDAHGMNLPTILSLGRRCGYSIPVQISILGIGGKNFFTFSDTPDAKMIQAIDGVIHAIDMILSRWIIKDFVAI